LERGTTKEDLEGLLCEIEKEVQELLNNKSKILSIFEEKTNRLTNYEVNAIIYIANGIFCL
jgi:hypothetical protein